MRPVGPFSHEFVEEQRGDRGSGKAVGVAVVDVGDIGFKIFAVALPQRQAPAGIVGCGAGGEEGLGGFILAGEQGGQVRADGGSGCAGKGCEVDDELRLVLAGAGQRIAQDQPALRIGIAYLDADPGARAQHVAGPESVAGHRIFDRWHQQMQAQLQSACHDQLRQSQCMRGAAHVLFHQQHAR